MLSKVKQKPKSKLSLQTVYKLTRETTHASPALSIGGQTLLQFLSSRSRSRTRRGNQSTNINICSAISLRYYQPPPRLLRTLVELSTEPRKTLQSMGNDISRAFSLLKTLLSLSQSSYNTKLQVTISADKHPNSLSSHCISLSVMPVYHIAL